MDVVENSTPPRNLAGSGYRNLFAENGRYVFDGNRVVARFRVGRNGVGRWRLETLDPGLSFVITPDLRIRKYRRTERTCVVRIVRQFETVLDTLKPLDTAIALCGEHGHRWSLAHSESACGEMPYRWEWCLTCGAEQVWVAETGEWLQWPDDADEIAVRTAGALPRLHGPVFAEGGRLL